MPSDRSLQTVAAIDPNEVPPGSVGMTLASGRPGIMTSDGETAVDERESLTAYDRRQQFLAMARKRWRQSADCESELRKDMLDDLRFYNAEQWPDHIKMDRVLDGRPCLTINRLPQFVRQVLNQARQQRPAIQYNPIDGGADVDTAEVLQGIARSIERQSNAPMHYTQASEHQVVIGRGWLRVRADWVAPDSFDQEILIEAMEDPFIVYPDPASGAPDGSDLMWAFLIARVPWYEYHTQYPRAERVSMYDWVSIGDEEAQWVDETGVLVAEYYYIELVKTQVAEVSIQITDTEPPVTATLYVDTIRPADTQPGPNGEPPLMTIRRTRDTLRRQLKWAKINGIEILEGNRDHTAGRDLPGRYIPLVPICGEKLVVNGERNLRGMVRDAKDPQRTYNFWVSAETEMIALAPRAPVIGAVGQFETTKEQWLMANRRNFPFLEYDPVDINGNLVPAPQRNAFDPNIVPIIQATQQADQDLKSVIGMFDASQEHSREQSGKAILARQAQGEQGTSHFLHNQSLSIQHVGRILLEWIPIYYDKPRIVRIIGLDDNERDVLVHAGNPEAAAQLQQQQHDALSTTLQSGALYDLNLGRYDVSVSVAPSFQSRRAEAVESMTQLLQAFPLAAPYALDVIAKNMDWPGARELAERFKHLVPAEARDDANNPLPPAAKQQLGQMKQQLDLATQQLQQQQQIIDTKRTEQQGLAQIRQLELQSNERLAQMKADVDLQKIQAQGRVDQQLQLLEARLEHINQAAEFLHERRMQLDAPAPEAAKGPAPRQTRPVSESLNYKDAPPDIRRQIEQQAGLQPSAMGALELAERRAKAIPKASTPGAAGAAPSGRPAVALGRRPAAPSKPKGRPKP